MAEVNELILLIGWKINQTGALRMHEIKETSPTNELHHGHKVVGATAVQLTPLEFTFNRGIRIRAPGATDPVANTLVVWVGRKGVSRTG
jgi:hypothetical protein